MRKSFFLFLLIVIFTTFVCGLVYATVQQEIRQNANDPQIQIAEDSAVEMANNQLPSLISSGKKVDIAKSLSPFVIVFDDKGKPIISSGLLDNQIPNPPMGVFDYVKLNGEDRVTWQPQNGVRVAAVITKYGGAKEGFILAGRSLREVEKREEKLMIQISIAWVVMLILGFLLMTVRQFAKEKK